MKLPKKTELQQMAINHSSDVDLDFMKIYKKFTADPYYFLVNKTNLPPDNPLRKKKKIF